MDILGSTTAKIESNWKDKLRELIDDMSTRIIELKAIVEGYYGTECTEFTIYAKTVNTDEEVRKAIKDYWSNVSDEKGIECATITANNLRFNRNKATTISNGALMTIIIRIPEIELESESGKKHKMVECYYKLNFQGSLRLSRCAFYRGKRTLAEHHSQYLFSHANRYNTQNSSGSELCYGSGTSMSNLYSQITNDSYYEDETAMFILGLKDYTAYESISGTPHIRISSITSPRSNSNYQMPDNAQQEAMYRALIAKGLDFKVNTYPGGLLKVNSDLEVWKQISTVCGPNNLFDYDVEANATLNVNASDTYAAATLAAYNANTLSQTLFKFKGVPIKEIVYDPETKDVKGDTMKLCKEGLREKILERINTRLNEYNNKQFHNYAY